MRIFLSRGLTALCFGSFLAGTTTAQVSINEFSYDDSSTDDREFVELYNRGPNPVDLTGWVLDAEDQAFPNSNNADCTLNGIIFPNSYFVIGAATVPLVNQVVGVNDLWENDQESITLRDSNGQVVDTVVYEANKGISAFASLAEGQGIWGNFTSIDNIETSWSRMVDGFDTDNNRDFVLLKSTPGADNNSYSGNPFIDDFDSAAPGTSLGNNWAGSFASPSVEDPTNLSQTNPNAIPASPDGGNCAMFWDSSGGGNANVLLTHPLAEVTLECYAYLRSAPYPAGFYESWSIGVQGSTGTYYNDPDPSGAIAAIRGFTVSANGNTGVSWTMQITDQNATLYLLEHNDGGTVAGGAMTGETILATIPIQAGLNDGWQRLSISICLGKVRARFGGTYGEADGTLVTGTTPVAVGQVYVGYREFVGDNSTLRPVSIDALSITSLAGVEYLGVAAATNSGTPELSANTCPTIGNRGFALEPSGCVPGTTTFFFGDLNVLNPPVNLASIGGVAGSLLYFLPSLSESINTDANGNGSFSAPIPLDPTIVGGEYHLQLLDPDFTLGVPLPIGTSRVLRLILH